MAVDATHEASKTAHRDTVSEMRWWRRGNRTNASEQPTGHDAFPSGAQESWPVADGVGSSPRDPQEVLPWAAPPHPE